MAVAFHMHRRPREKIGVILFQQGGGNVFDKIISQIRLDIVLHAVFGKGQVAFAPMGGAVGIHEFIHQLRNSDGLYFSSLYRRSQSPFLFCDRNLGATKDRFFLGLKAF